MPHTSETYARSNTLSALESGDWNQSVRKGSLCAGEKVSPPGPDCLGTTRPCGRSTILASWGVPRGEGQGAAARGQRGPATKTHIGDTRRQRPRKEELERVWGQEGAGSQSGEEQGPLWSSVRVRALHLWAPFALEFSSTVPWSGSGAGGYVGPGSRPQGLGQAGVPNQTDM